MIDIDIVEVGGDLLPLEVPLLPPPPMISLPVSTRSSQMFSNGSLTPGVVACVGAELAARIYDPARADMIVRRAAFLGIMRQLIE